MKVVVFALLPALAAAAKCKCKFQDVGEIPAAAATAAGNKHYGVDCATKHDSVAGTKYYKNDTQCPDKCIKGCNYLALEWCYVDRGCEGAKYFNTTLDGAGDLAYSYDVCGNPYCWDPWGWEATCPGSHKCKAIPDQCACKFQAAGRIPWQAEAAAGNKHYGVDCSTKHDSVPGTKYYKDDTACPDKCIKGCNYLALEWCYVERGCVGAKYFNTTLEGAGELSYSYDVCGNPYCWDPWGWEATCPGSHACQASPSACSCKFEKAGRIPWMAADKAGSTTYGVDCSSKHDSVVGTKYYKDDTQCPDKCVKGCNYLTLEWCYVERGCTGKKYFNTTLEGAGDLSYSYDMCGNPYCWDPWGWEEGCPAGAACAGASSTQSASSTADPHAAHDHDDDDHDDHGTTSAPGTDVSPATRQMLAFGAFGVTLSASF
jgi:hypothetical protein